jgi:hypothetical protein
LPRNDQDEAARRLTQYFSISLLHQPQPSQFHPQFPPSNKPTRRTVLPAQANANPRTEDATMRRLVLLLALLAAATPASAGPPWIAVEYPANPLHADSRGALLLVHTFHHGASRAFPVVGYAEGMVDGRRVRRELTVTPTYRPGVHAVRGDLDGGSAWVLVLTMTDSDTNVMESMLVALNGDRALTAVDIPYATSNEWDEPRAATAEQIDRFLAMSVALAEAEPGVRRVRAAIDPDEGVPAVAWLAGLLLLPVAVFGIRRVRKSL